MPSRIRLAGQGRILVDVEGRSVEIHGEISLPRDGRSGFSLETSTRWRWADGRAMTEPERQRLLDAIPRIGEEEGWVLTLGEGPWTPPPPITSLFEFKGRKRLVWTSGAITVVVPGTFGVNGPWATFEMDMSGEWTRPDGSSLSPQEIDAMADAIRKAAPANGVVITTTGRPRDLS